MQKENISYDAIVNTSSPPDFSLSNPFLSPTSNDASFYASLFQNCSPTSDAASYDGGGDVLEYQQLYNSYALCLARLRDSIEEVDALRHENDSLRLSNADLSRRVALLFSRDRIFSDFGRLSIVAPGSAAAHVTATAQPVAEQYRVERRGSTERVTSLPKSIAVRSSGYLKMSAPPGGSGDAAGHRAVSQPAAASTQQRVYIPGPKKEESMELDVYNQGMWKTELCNKWQETGACPYGHNCQFAHGIKELRPVIRHPRYKTQVCRMVLAGDICPYGHRCHFRHSLTEEERLVAAQPHR